MCLSILCLFLFLSFFLTLFVTFFIYLFTFFLTHSPSLSLSLSLFSLSLSLSLSLCLSVPSSHVSVMCTLCQDAPVLAVANKAGEFQNLCQRSYFYRHLIYTSNDRKETSDLGGSIIRFYFTFLLCYYPKSMWQLRIFSSLFFHKK